MKHYETATTTAGTLPRIRAALEASPARSAWNRGVKEYAAELLRLEERFKQLNARMRQLYADIMVNENMIAYNKAKGDMDAVLQNMNGIIDLCIQGEDPDTCEMASGCTGSCATCGGCH